MSDAGDELGATEPRPPRPASLIVFGVISILWGALGLCSPLAQLPMLLLEPDQLAGNPAAQILAESPTLRVMTWVNMAVGFLLGGVSVAGGIGLLRSRAWGRTLLVAWAWVSLGAAVVAFVLNSIHFFPALVERAREMGDPAMRSALSLALGTGICCGLGALAYPILLLVFMSRPNVKAHLARASGGGVPSGG